MDTKLIASEPGRVLTYESKFSTQTLKSSRTSCYDVGAFLSHFIVQENISVEKAVNISMILKKLQFVQGIMRYYTLFVCCLAVQRPILGIY